MADLKIPEGTKAVRIASRVLNADIWLVFDPLFRFDEEGLACFYDFEIPKLRNKTEAQLREIHRSKLAFPFARVSR